MWRCHRIRQRRAVRVVPGVVLQRRPHDGGTSCASWRTFGAGPDVVNAGPTPVSV